MRKIPAGIIPPIVLENLEQNAPTAEARLAARRTLILSERVRGLREERAVEPGLGEDREVYDAEESEDLPGRKVRDEDEPAVGDEAVNEAYDGSGHTYALYHQVYNRRSLDGEGMRLISSVHVGREFDNAFWDGSQMAYGDGHYFNPFTRALSVIGHELTHGVVQFTCGLVYRDQPGALNEHLADVFGCLVVQRVLGLRPTEDRGWLVGAELCTGRITGRALRDMLHPGTAYNDQVIGADPQPAHMDPAKDPTGRGYQNTREDSGGVHINSGIPNRAFALAARQFPAIAAWESVGPIWYETMARRIGARAQFAEFAAATYTVASERDPALRDAVGEGWAQVGINVATLPPAPPPPETEPSPCEAELLGLLRDPVIRQAAADVFARPAMRRFAARARLLSVTPAK